MAGFTPQLATAVWVGTETSRPVREPDGTPMSGSGTPARIWMQVTDAGLAGQPGRRPSTATPPPGWADQAP